MGRLSFIPAVLAVLVCGISSAFAQTATVVLRDGQRLRAEVIGMGRSFTLRVDGGDRLVPVSDVALVDFAGNGRNIPTDELLKVNSSRRGYVVMRSGEQFGARLEDITGTPPVAVFSDGTRSRLREISRIYLGPVNNVPGFPNIVASGRPAPDGQDWARRQDPRNQDPYERRSNPPRDARSVVVPSNVQWTNTGISVTRGQWLRFEPSGEIRLSFNGEDIARAAGALSFRHNDKATIPTIPVGALIGRVGNGKAFSIGDTREAFDMPANGRLYLGVNDDHFPDNSGNFVVRVWEP